MDDGGVGPGRIEGWLTGHGVVGQIDYDSVRRVVGTKHFEEPGVGTTVYDERTYQWDAVYNQVQRKDVRVVGPRWTHDYSYDSAYRLIDTQVTDGSIPPQTIRSTAYALDGVQNRLSVTGAGTPDPGTYTMDPLVDDDDVNQYTTTSFDARTYLPNGNLRKINDGLTPASIRRNLIYDYANRMAGFVIQ